MSGVMAVFLFFLSNIVFSCAGVKAPGDTEVSDDTKVSDNYSNAAVLGSISPDSENTPFMVYKLDDFLHLDYFDYRNENGKYTTEIVKTKKIEEINLSDKYKIILLKRNVFLLTDKKLYTFVVPEKIDDADITAEFITEITEITDIWPCDDNCFYTKSDGTLYLYNFPEIEPLNSTGTRIEPLDALDGTLIIAKLDDIIIASKKSMDGWFNEFKKESVNFVSNGFTLNEEDKALLLRYLMFNNMNNKDAYKSGAIFNTLDEWCAHLKAEYGKIGQENMVARREFVDKWNVEPGRELFPETLPFNDSLYKAVSISASSYPGFKKEPVAFLIRYYNKIVDTYNKMARNGKISDNIKQMLESNCTMIHNELKSIIDTEKRKYEIATNELRDTIKKNDERFPELFVDSLSKINPDTYMANPDFDYYFLPLLEGKQYVILRKSLNESDEIDEFRKLGQNTYSLGLLNNNIYSIEDGTVKLYDPFTLKEIEDRKYDPGVDGERILFSIDWQKGIVITAVQERGKTTYYIREISVEHGTLKLKEPQAKIISNDSSSAKSYTVPFWTTSEFADEGYIYINSYKSNSKPKDDNGKEYVYVEAPSGAGIIKIIKPEVVK